MERLFLVFVLLLAVSIQVHAREGRFFSRTVRPAEASPASIGREPSPSSAAGLPAQSRNGFGLYGRDGGRDRFPSMASPATAASGYGFNGDRGNNNAYEETNPMPSTLTGAAGGFSSGSRAYNQPYYDGRYGMSDARVRENGRYFSDVNKENHEPANSGVTPERSSHGSYGDNSDGDRNNDGGNEDGSYERDRYKNELEAYLNSKENLEGQADYIDP